MESSTFKSAIEFEFFLKMNLNYEVISTMDMNEYKIFVKDLFKGLNELKKRGLERKDIFEFVQNHCYNIMSFADEDDVIFERKFSAITEELIEFCSDPSFWNSDFDIYIKKWDKRFETSWYEKI